MPRNLSGVYTLPAGNPVVPGTTIDAAWANSTLSDISNELTNSLSRTGAGGMLAPFRIDDGNVTGPGLAFLNETNTGYFRSGAGATAFSVLGVSTLQLNTTAVTVPSTRTLNAQGNALVGGTLGVTGAATFASTVGVTGALTATGGVLGNITAASGTSTFNNVVINGSLDMVAGSSATITGLSTPVNASDAANKGYADTQDALKLDLAGGTMSGNIAMGNNLVTGVGTPVSGGDATNKTYVDGQIATRLATAGGTMTGAIAMSSQKITGLGTPTADADAATKAYVDSVAQGLDVKGSVRAATTANITLSGTQTIDGVAIGAGDRVLVKDQSTASQNGIYVAAAGAWSRSSDADTWAELVGAFVFVEDGTVNDNSGWVCTVAPGGTLGSTAVTFEQFSGAGQITAGAGMVKVGNTLNVQSASASRIVVGADEIDLATTGVGAGTYRSVTVDTYGRVTGGTNPTTLAGYGITDAYTQTQTDTLLAAKLSLTGGTMSGALAMGTNKITGLGNPTNAQDAATKTYVDTADALKLNLTGGTLSGSLALGTNRITGMGDPVNAQDAATKNYIDTIFGSTTSAAASAAAAASSASAASTSASNASSSASAAAASATSAANSFDSFDDRYLGSKTSDPTVDNDGNPLLTGALYWNSVANTMKVWNGSAWVGFGLSGGVNNGVAYVSGGTLTTGSALSFDGTNLALSNSAVATAYRIDGSGRYKQFEALHSGTREFYFGYDSTDLIGRIYQDNNRPISFGISGTEAMRLTSTSLYTASGINVGIGLSNPAYKLDIYSASGTAAIKLQTSTNTAWSLTSQLIGVSNNGFAIRDETAGVNRLSIDASGNVGIGTSSPAAPLSFASATGQKIRFYNGVSGYGIGVESSEFRFVTDSSASFTWRNGSYSGGTAYMTLDASGNLLVGQTSQDAKFNLNGPSTSTSNPQIRIRNSADGSGNSHLDIGYYYQSGVGEYAFIQSFTDYGSAPRDLILQPRGGNVGIGTTSPGQLLDVSKSQNADTVIRVTNANTGGSAAAQFFASNGTTQTQFFHTGTAYSGVGVLATAGTGGVYNNNAPGLAFVAANASAPIMFATGGTTERARLTSGGNLLVGTQTDRGTAGISLIPNTSAGAGEITFNRANTTSTSYVMGFQNAGTTVGYIAYTNSTVTYNTGSDARLKENVSPAPAAGSIIDAIDIVQHDWKSGGHADFSVIAQDLHQVYPQAVTPGDAGEQITQTWGVDYSKLVPLLIAEVQSLRARLAAANL